MPREYQYPFELRHLVYFREVARRLHFRKAAEALAIAQPALSRQIAQLEAALGVRLLNRSSRRVELTAAGAALVEAIEPVLSALMRVPADLQAVAGGRVWIANSFYPQTGGDQGWVTELSARTGALIRVISARRDRLTDPEAVAAVGDRVWVVNSFGDSLVELDAATGALIRVIAAARYQLSDPGAVAADGNRLWVANAGGDSVTEIDAATGALIRVIAGARYQLNSGGFSVAIAAAGGRVWVPTPPVTRSPRSTPPPAR